MANIVRSFRRKISDATYGDIIHFGAKAENVTVSGIDRGSAQQEFDKITLNLTSINTTLGMKIDKSSITSDLTGSSTTLVLSQAAGKVLKDWIGSSTLTTTSQNLSGAVNELVTTIGNVNTTLTNKFNNYLPLTGGTLSGSILFSDSGLVHRGIQGIMATNDIWRISGAGTAVDSGYLEIATGDNGNEPIYVRQYSSGNFGTLTRTATLLDASGNTVFPGVVSAGSRFIANVGTGTSPLTVVSTTLCSNLNADMLDGYHSSAFQPAGSYMAARPNGIEFQPNSTSEGHGGHLDFHFNQSTADYTSRIIEQTSGLLTVNGLRLSVGLVSYATIISSAPSNTYYLYAY